MDTRIKDLHAATQYFEAIGCWGMARQLRMILLAALLGLAACAKPSSHDSLSCSGPDLDNQQVSWPDGTSRKSDVYHCANGMDLVKDNADLSVEFWRQTQ